MPRYEYKGGGSRSFPAQGITVKNGESFDGPEGLKAPGLSIVSSAKTAPAVPTAPKEAPKEIAKEEPIKQSAPSDTTAGA
jgi:hypothetical protein